MHQITSFTVFFSAETCLVFILKLSLVHSLRNVSHIQRSNYVFVCQFEKSESETSSLESGALAQCENCESSLK